MKRILLVFFAIALLTLTAVDSDAQQVKKGSLSGTIVSATACAELGSTAPLLSAPSSGVLVVTQFCIAEVLAGACANQDDARIETSSSGSMTGGNCTTYEPGWEIEPGDQLTCVARDLNYAARCNVTGVISKK